MGQFPRMDPIVDASFPAPGSRDRSRVALTVALAAGLVLSVIVFAVVRTWEAGGLRAGSAWAALVSGLLLTGLVAAYVRTLTTRTARMEREVVLRTAELSASNASHRDHARRLATLAEVTRSFTTALDPAAVARHILEAAQVLIYGALAIVTREAHEFSADEVALLRTFAVHAAIAIANARLHDSALRRARLLATLNDLSRRLTTTLDPTAVAGEILAAAQVLIPGAGADLWE